MEYKVIERTIAAVALKAMNGHLWYLTQELLPLALFSNLEEELKENIVEVLKEHEHDTGASPRRTGAEYGKPSFSVLSKEATVDRAKFTRKDSFLFFKILKLETAFLHTTVSEWPGEQSYLSAMEVVGHFSVVNDSAEPGVKLCHDFLQISTQSRLQNVLQVVKNNRNAVPTNSNGKLNQKFGL